MNNPSKQYPTIKYNASQYAWDNFETKLRDLIKEYGATRICEIGGGANPALSLEFLAQNNIKYTILDVSPDELAKAPQGYSTICADITKPDLHFTETETFDLVFSKMLAEHVKNGELFHRNAYKLLQRGGIAFHFFPTLYAPPFILNRLLPERLAEKILHIFQPGRAREGHHAKFPAYYSWCTGPLSSQIRRLERLGYEVIEYIGFFGHSSYYKKIPHLEQFSQFISRSLQEHPIPWLTSFSYLVIRKP